MCTLRAGGADFDVDAFLRGSTLEPTRVYRRGERRPFPDSEPLTSSGCNITVSDAGWSELETQLADCERFLAARADELRRLVAFPGVEGVGLDIPVNQRIGRNTVTQSMYAPPSLARLAGEIGLTIRFSMYPTEDRGPGKGPRLYGDLAWVWPLLSPPEDYGEEAGVLARMLREAGVPGDGTLLHLGSGGGSLDFHLRQHFSITGVDLSPAMVEHARDVNPEVTYVVGDMREVALGRTFDAVLLHDGQAYLTAPEDLRAAHETAARHLAPGGVLISTPEQLRHLFVQDGVTENPTLADDEASVTTIEVHHDPDPKDHWFETTFLYVIRENGNQHVELDVHRHGIWDLEEVLEVIRQAGFAEPVVSEPKLSDMEAGEWVVVVARKG